MGIYNTQLCSHTKPLNAPPHLQLPTTAPTTDAEVFVRGGGSERGGLN